MKGNYHENDQLFQLSSEGNNYLQNNAFKWVQGEQAVTVYRLSKCKLKNIVYGAYHFVSCLKGFNNSIAYSLKCKIDFLLSAKSNSCFT